MKPLIINSIYKEKIWGSNKLLQEFCNATEEKKIGETWNLVLDNNDISSFQDFNLDIKKIFLNKDICKKVLGNKMAENKKFPLLIKTLFINDKISLQVHPNNKFAQIDGNDFGKNEVWYVLYADEDAYANIGFKHKISKKQVRKFLEEDKIMKYLKKVKIKAGDVINIPAGTVHSISGKAILYEVQQNSNITYRLYDWYGRSLEIDKALKVLKNKNVTVKNKESGRLIKTKDFTIYRINVLGKKEIKNKNQMEIVTVIEGEGTLVAGKNIELHKGMTILIPASIKKYIIVGRLSLLITS